jgi:hypothetical protein
MPKVDTTPPPIIAAPDNRDATRQSDAEMRRRRARSGAAANILTSPVGIPATAQLGAPA